MFNQIRLTWSDDSCRRIVLHCFDRICFYMSDIRMKTQTVHLGRNRIWIRFFRLNRSCDLSGYKWMNQWFGFFWLGLRLEVCVRTGITWTTTKKKKTKTIVQGGGFSFMHVWAGCQRGNSNIDCSHYHQHVAITGWSGSWWLKLDYYFVHILENRAK